MQFNQLRIHDAVLAILISCVAIAAGASSRGALARRFVAAVASPTQVAEPHPVVAAPRTPIRVITKAPEGASVFEQPDRSARPVAQIKAGAVVEATATDTAGWLRVRTQSGTAGWVSEDSVATEADSLDAVALFAAPIGPSKDKVRAPRTGALYATLKLTERIGGFTRGETVEIVRAEGRAVLVTVSDGAGGKVVGYARAADVRAVVAPPPTRTVPDANAETGDPVGAGTASTDSERPSTNAGDDALKEAQDQYASGNFREAAARAEEAERLGAAEAVVIAAMSACKLGDINKAMRIAKRLRGARLSQFRSACPDTPPATPATDGSAQPPTGPAPRAGDEQEVH